MRADECIFFQMAKAAQKAVRFLTSKIEHLGITAVQAMILNFLSEEDEITSNRLGERTLLDSATLTGILDRLEAHGFIERGQHPRDRRAILISLTPRGRELATDIRKIAERSNREIFRNFSRDDEITFRNHLERIRKS